MFTPFIFSGVEECCHAAALGINSRYIRTFLQIAVPTRKRQVFQLCRTAVLPGNNVLHVKWTAISCLRQMTILAPIACA